MDHELVEEVRAIQHAMAEAAGECLATSEIEHLAVLIRLTVEFHYYLQGTSVEQLERNRVRYSDESVFAGIESFCSVSAAYRMLSGSRETTLRWEGMSLSWVKERFNSVFDSFEGATEFELKCRFLLDLFKLQIVFAGITYE